MTSTSPIPPRRPARPTDWPAERIERLRIAWCEERKTARAIAKDLGITKNAAMGKISRMGWTRDQRPLEERKSVRLKTYPTEVVERVRKLRGDGLSLDTIAGIVSIARSTIRAWCEDITVAIMNRGAFGAPSRVKHPRSAVVRFLPPRALPEVAPATENAPTARPDGLLGILELRHNTCRYPVGNPGESGFGFCGQQTRSGSAYCPGHHARCYQPRHSETEAA